MKNEESANKISLILPGIIEDINRYRDWPIKILTFTSALHFGLIYIFISQKINLEYWTNFALTIIIIVLLLWTIYYFYRCHKSYLELRIIQSNLQKKMQLDNWKINEDYIFPRGWFKRKSTCACKGFWGWGFYAFYAFILVFFSLSIIWKWGII